MSCWLDYSVTASYKLTWKSSAERELRQLPKEVIIKLLALAESLCQNPFPSGVKKLQGAQHTYRVRSGDYRLVYEVCGNELQVQIICVGHRREVYR
jgi:mRNA interferase RelE/StbE